MPRVSGQKDYIALNKGLITEASPLAFPEGATADELNFTINKNGLFRERRKGFSPLYENYSNFIGQGANLENLFYWRGSGYVIAIVFTDTPETYLRIHTMDEDFSKVVDIKIADAKVSTQVAELTNYLVITLSNNSRPVMLEYREDDEEIVVSEVQIHVRDFELVDDGLSASERISTLSDNHLYNILNAGWYVSKKDETTSGNPSRSTYVIFDDATGVYPSNADVVSLGMITNSSGDYTFDPEYVKDAGLGNSLAPRGHYIFALEGFDRDARIATPSNDGSPSTTLSFLGTANLSGSPTYNPDDPDNPDNPDTPWDPYPDIPWWKNEDGVRRSDP